MEGTYRDLVFLVWPLQPLPPTEEAAFHYHRVDLIGLVADLDAAALANHPGNFFVLQLWLVVLALLLWTVQGMPPVGAAYRWALQEFGPWPLLASIGRGHERNGFYVRR